MKVWAISDVHVDYADNLSWVENLSTTEYQNDTLIVAGDISDKLSLIRQTLQLFAQRWKEVFFTWGNHELWVRGEEEEGLDSLDKIAALNGICRELGIHFAPKLVEGVWIVPIISWYHSSFDREPDVPGAPDITQVMTDFHACRWPNDLPQEQVAEFMDRLNDSAFVDLEHHLEDDLPIITFSHFVPLQRLLPEKRMLYQPNLPKAAGSDYLAARIKQLRPMVHVFGHTHFPWDTIIDGIRYCQWPLSYPRERRKRPNGANWLPLLVYDTESGLSKRHSSYWSDFYDLSERDPSNVDPAPWVNLGKHGLDSIGSFEGKAPGHF